MRWTKEHSQNAVAAKARLRIERAEREPAPARRMACPRKPAADFIIQIRSRSGDRAQLSVIRYDKQFLTQDGVKSARNISRGIELLLRYATP